MSRPKHWACLKEDIRLIDNDQAFLLLTTVEYFRLIVEPNAYIKIGPDRSIGWQSVSVMALATDCNY